MLHNNNGTANSTGTGAVSGTGNPLQRHESRKSQSRRSSYTQQARASKRRKSSIQISEPSDNQKFLPAEYIHCDKMELITIISRMLSSIVSINDSRTSLDVHYLNSASLTRFHSRSPPHISIYSYLVRLSHYSSLENCVLIATVYYIDLLTIKYPSFALNSLTVHRFLLTATTIASKALCDFFCSNNHYAKVGGVNIIELNLLEVEFLKWVNYRVIPRDFNYDSVCERKNSAGAVEVNQVNSLKFGISTAEEILSLYYEKMIGLVGGGNLDANGADKSIIQVGHNDDQIYRLEVPDDLASLMSSSSSSSSSSLSSNETEDDEGSSAYKGGEPLNTHPEAGKASHKSEKAPATTKPVVGSNGSRKNSLNILISPSAASTPTTTNSAAMGANNRLSRPTLNTTVPNDLQVNSPVDTLQLNSRIPSTANIVTAQMKSNTSPTFLQSPGISTYSPV